MHFDRAYTSVLQRANETLDIILRAIGQTDLPVERDAALNERHYGELQGLNKAETAKKYGDEQVHIWRRSYDVAAAGRREPQGHRGAHAAVLRIGPSCRGCAPARTCWSSRTATRCARSSCTSTS